jgi:hypothetical protein
VTKEEALSTFLQEVSQNIPKDMVDLEDVSGSIISEWIRLGFDYPNDTLDSFVYIKSDIEDYIENKTKKTLESIKFTSECKEIYDFHIGSFIESLAELQALVRKKD